MNSDNPNVPQHKITLYPLESKHITEYNLSLVKDNEALKQRIEDL